MPHAHRSESYDREIVADFQPHYEGQRQLVDWERLDSAGRVVTHRDVPVVYLKQVSKADYLARNPGAPDLGLEDYSFWEVSVD